MATWSDVRRITQTLPGTTEDHSSSGKMWWIVSRKGYAWERPLRKSDIEALGKRAPKGAVLGLKTADLEMKDVLLASNPKVFFTTPHFDGYPAVLVRIPALARLDRDELEDLVVEAWLTRAQKRVAKAWLDEHGVAP